MLPLIGASSLFELEPPQFLRAHRLVTGKSLRFVSIEVDRLSVFKASPMRYSRHRYLSKDTDTHETQEYNSMIMTHYG